MDIVQIILQSILSAITPQINVSLVIGVLAGVIGASIGLVFMWWGIRKLIHVMMVAFMSGGLSVGGEDYHKKYKVYTGYGNGERPDNPMKDSTHFW